MEEGISSSWFFLPPKDKRYLGTEPAKIRKYIRNLKADGFEIGYHVNAWEQPGTYALVKDPLKRLDEDLEWFADTLGEPVRVATAHGIPRHKDIASNFSMYDALIARGVSMLDLFVIEDGGIGKRIPHFGFRSKNPLLQEGQIITYTSDSGGPIRKEWIDFATILQPGQVIILNTHCGNYDIHRSFSYLDANLHAIHR